MTHEAILIEWVIREPEGAVRIDGISLHQTKKDVFDFEKFWKVNHDIEGDFWILSATTLMVSDEIWKKIQGVPAGNKQYFRHEQFI